MPHAVKFLNFSGRAAAHSERRWSYIGIPVASASGAPKTCNKPIGERMTQVTNASAAGDLFIMTLGNAAVRAATLQKNL